MKTIMILGGGYYQLPLIQTSVRMGINTIVCGIAGNYPGYKYATEWLDIDIFDKEAILKAAIKHKIDGILLCGTDSCMPTIGYVCDKLNLLGPSEQSTINASNKYLMKECFIKHGVRTAAFSKITSLYEAEVFANNHYFPVVLKVVDASGSRGIAIIQNIEDLRKLYPIVTAETKKDYLIIEEFVKGIEFGAQSFIRDGELTFVLPHGDLVFHSDTDVPVGHYAPFERDDIIEDIRNQLQLSIKSLGINNTAINADFIFSNEKVYVLEIGARAGATCLPELVSNYYGINYYEYLIRQSLGETCPFNLLSHSPSLVETLISTKSGKITNITIGQLPKEVISMELYPTIGDNVSQFRNAYDRIGTLILRGENLQDLFKISAKIKNDVLKIDIL